MLSREQTALVIPDLIIGIITTALHNDSERPDYFNHQLFLEKIVLITKIVARAFSADTIYWLVHEKFPRDLKNVPALLPVHQSFLENYVFSSLGCPRKD